MGWILAKVNKGRTFRDTVPLKADCNILGNKSARIGVFATVNYLIVFATIVHKPALTILPQFCCIIAQPRSHHFAIVHGEEGVEVGYVEEDDQEGEEWAEEAHHHQQAQLRDVRQRAQADPGRARAQQAREARHACYLR